MGISMGMRRRMPILFTRYTHADAHRYEYQHGYRYIYKPFFSANSSISV